MKTINYEAEIAVSYTNGLDIIQVLPENTCEEVVKPLKGYGYGLLRSNGGFDFLRRRRKRRRPVLKQTHSSLSFGRDHFDRFYFQLPSCQRNEFEKLFRRETRALFEFIRANLQDL